MLSKEKGMVRTDLSVASDLSSQEDDLLLEQFCRGEAEAFEQIVLKYQNRVFGLALRMLRDRAEAEEASQEVFLKVFRALRDFRGGSKFSTWLYSIACRHFLNHLKARRRREMGAFPFHRDGLDPSPLPDAVVEEKELRALVEGELMRLKEEHRLVLILRDIQGLSYEEIAEALGVELGTVRSRLHRARMELKEQLERFL